MKRFKDMPGNLSIFKKRGFSAREPIADSTRNFGLIKDEDKLNFLIEDAALMIGIIQNMKFVYLNPFAEQVIGFSREELLHKRISGLIHPDFRKIIVEKAKICLKKGYGPFRIEIKVNTKTGEDKWLDFSMARCNYREKPALIACAIDNTARRIAEERLRKNEEIFRVALQNSGMIVAQIDTELRYTWIHNPHPHFKPSDILGKRDDEISSGPGFCELMAFKKEVIQSGVGGRREIKFLFSNGYRHYDITIEPLRDISGNIIGATTAAMDITSRKQAEEILQKLNEELEIRIHQRTKELSIANQELQKKISERKVMEKELKKVTGHLEYDRKELFRKNTALSEILNQIENEKEQMKQQISHNIEQQILPILYRMKESSPETQMQLIEILEKGLQEIASPFLANLKNSYHKLSPREIEICNFIRNGLSSKEIAGILNISLLTVQKHRELIRKKLGLVQSSINLKSYLLSLA